MDNEALKTPPITGRFSPGLPSTSQTAAFVSPLQDQASRVTVHVRVFQVSVQGLLLRLPGSSLLATSVSPSMSTIQLAHTFVSELTCLRHPRLNMASLLPA